MTNLETLVKQLEYHNTEAALIIGVIRAAALAETKPTIGVQPLMMPTHVCPVNQVCHVCSDRKYP